MGPCDHGPWALGSRAWASSKTSSRAAEVVALRKFSATPSMAVSNCNNLPDHGLSGHKQGRERHAVALCQAGQRSPPQGAAIVPANLPAGIGLAFPCAVTVFHFDRATPCASDLICARLARETGCRLFMDLRGDRDCCPWGARRSSPECWRSMVSPSQPRVGSAQCQVVYASSTMPRV